MWPAEICSVFINLEAQLLGPKPKATLRSIFSIQTFLISTASSACLSMQTFYSIEHESSLCATHSAISSCCLRLFLVSPYKMAIKLYNPCQICI